MTTWDEQEEAADRREAIENEAGERAAAHFASPEALLKALEETCLGDEELRAEAEALCCMMHAHVTSDSAQVILFESEALAAMRKMLELVFGNLAADEKAKIERGE